MNLRDLEYVLAVAQTKNFNKAAQSCFVSQPALSMQIKKLEDELGVNIFERFQKTVLVTPEGSVLIEKMQALLNIAKDIKHTAESFRQKDAQLFKIGLFPTLAQYLLPPLIKAIQQTHSDIQIYPVEEKTDVLLNMLKTGQLDAALLANPTLPPGMAFTPLFEDTFTLAVYEGHPLAKKKEIDIKQLNDESMLFLEKGHCLRDQVMALNINPAQSIQCNATGLETLRQMVIAKLGITIIPQIATYSTPFSGICYINFKKPAPSRQVGIVYRKTSVMSQWVQKFQVLVEKTLASLTSH
ncbi:LysR substrate-binding domain-containing protein [Facilibium subflavum]|uniref:LysR substrate-binding domain-containing protein n=1 Tax=Facilibium subflavum TaxID=2219058 RepID=UPI000E646295|nr:LysR substrate-binding domain-containing protein [Facilibium subflavum]